MDYDNLQRALSLAELVELDLQLRALDAMTLSTVEGFVTAVVINPQPVPPEQFFPWIWDPDLGEVEPADSEETEATLGLLSRFMANPALDIANNLHGFEPLFLKSPKLANSADWCNGFLAGTRFLPKLWEHVVQQTPNVFEAIARLSDPEEQVERSELERLVACNVLGLTVALRSQQTAG